jgi:putative ABC transport system permease protein
MDLWQDVRYAARRLVEARWFTLAAVTALALGIGANTTVFTFVNAVLLRGLPFNDPDRIMAVWTQHENGQQMGASYLDYRDWRDQSRAFDNLAADLNSQVNVSDDEQLPEQVSGSYVTGNFFRMIEVQPIRGRDFTDGDDLPGAEPVVMLGYSVWQNRYEGDDAILGRTIRVNSRVVTVVGVMPEDMRFPDNTDIWIPQTNLPPGSATNDRGTRGFNVVGRLASGVSIEQAREELRSIGAGLAEEYPDTNADLGPELSSFVERSNGDQIRVVFLSLMGAVAFVLLIACANVANLLLARSSERSREIAVRVSIGATRARIVRQLLVESLLLAVVAGIIGLGLSVLGIHWFDAQTQNVGKPYWMVFSMDGVVFAFMAAVCLATAVLFGLAPALQVSRTDVNEVLKEGMRGGTVGFRSRRWSGALIVGEMVLTIVLLSGAAFMMRSFMSLYTLDLGIETRGLVTMQIYLPLTKYPQPGPRRDLYRNFLDRLDGLPEIRSSTIANASPLSGGGAAGLEVDGRVAEPGETRPTVSSLAVSEDYFGTLGIEPLRGRTFTREDGLPGSEVAIVNQRFADLYLGDGDPLGRSIRLVDNPDAGEAAPWLTVVGITPTIRQRNLEDIEPDPVVYTPLAFNPVRGAILIVRTQGDQAAATSIVRETMRAVEPDIPLYDIMTLDQRIARERWPFRVFGTMFSMFAAIALILSAVGLYSVTAHSVVQRIREFGIRVSLGAKPGQISWLALRRVLIHLAIGLPIGLAGAFAVGAILQSLLVQTSPRDPVTLVTVVLVMVMVAILACLWPARRGGRLDPVAALRVE